MTSRNLGLTFLGTLLATTALGCVSAAASNCASLAGISLPVLNTTITAEEMPAGTFMGQTKEDLNKGMELGEGA